MEIFALEIINVGDMCYKLLSLKHFISFLLRKHNVSQGAKSFV